MNNFFNSSRFPALLAPYTVIVGSPHYLERRGLEAEVDGRDGKYKLVGSASTPNELIVKVKQESPKIVIMNLSMGQGTDFNLVENVKEQGNGNVPRVMMLSRLQAVSDAHKLIGEMGVRAYLGSDPSATDLRYASDKVVNGEIYIHPSIQEMFVRFLSGGNGHFGEGKRGFYAITDRERQVFELIGEGLSNEQIAAVLERSIKTVEKHRQHLYSKLGIPGGSIAGIAGQYVAVIRYLPISEQNRYLEDILSNQQRNPSSQFIVSDR